MDKGSAIIELSDAGSDRDKSMITKKKEDALKARMARSGVKESDLVEHFIRSRGPGGQNVNKTSTGVYIKHIPTGIEVKVFTERSQALNRYAARKILAERIETIVLGRESEERKRIEKIRRQKRKRSKRAKEKMLHNKKMRSEKKELRKSIGSTSPIDM
jgi:protein subunit release factor B